MINACATVTEKVDFDGVDSIANMVEPWADLIANARADPHHLI